MLGGMAKPYGLAPDWRLVDDPRRGTWRLEHRAGGRWRKFFETHSRTELRKVIRLNLPPLSAETRRWLRFLELFHEPPQPTPPASRSTSSSESS